MGLLGPNGAGKSTLVRLLSGVMLPDSGSVEMYGYNIDNNLMDIKRITGLLPEEYALYEKLTIREYVQFIASLYDISSDTFESRFNILVKKLNLHSMENRIIETLSKGQKQKVAIICSIIHEPKVVLFDEPMANLDVRAQQIVKNIIFEYKSQSRIIVIATHLLSNVENFCNYLLVIDKGKILYQGDLVSFIGDHNSLESAYLSFFK